MNFYPVPLSSTHSENKSSRIAFVLRGVRYFERWSNYVTHVALYRYRTPDWAWRVSKPSSTLGKTGGASLSRNRRLHTYMLLI